MISSFELIEMFTSDFKKPLIKFLLTFIVGASSLVYGFALEAESRGILPFEAEVTFFLGFVICVILTLATVKDIKYTKRFIESSALSLLYVSFFPFAFLFNSNELWSRLSYNGSHFSLGL